MEGIIAFILIFSIIVIIHEFGHYYFAKRAGILVREFAIGMGPKIFHYEGEETTYTLRLLPVGGYVRMAGLEEMGDSVEKGMQVIINTDQSNIVQRISLNNDVQDQTGLPIEVLEADLEKEMFIYGIPFGQDKAQRFAVDKEAELVELDGTILKVAPVERQFQSASIWNRLITNFAGPMNNFILAILAFILVAFLQGGVYTNEPIVGVVVADSPAQLANLETGDVVTRINDEAIETFDEMIAIVQSSPNKKLEFTVERGGQSQQLTIQPNESTNSDKGKIGMIGISRPLKTDFMSKIVYGFTATWAVITGIFGVIGSMMRNGFNIDNFGGPVYIYQATSQVAALGLTSMVSLLAWLSVNLGIVNLLPIPALDGGKIVINLIEAVRGKPLSVKAEGMINLFGAALLIILMIAVTWNDIQRFFG